MDLFYIIFPAIIVFQILVLVLNLDMIPVSKAGKVSNNFHFRYRLSCDSKFKTIFLNGESIDLSSCKKMYVRGNSMKNYGIYDRQTIFVSPFLDNLEKEKIQTFPVLVFHIFPEDVKGYKPKKWDSCYKLRKFVTYIDLSKEVDWKQIYEKYQSRINVSLDSFISDCECKMTNCTKKGELYILSETFDESIGQIKYSLHPISSLYAKVKYVA